MVGRTPPSAANPLVGLFRYGRCVNPRKERDGGVPCGPGGPPHKSHYTRVTLLPDRPQRFLGSRQTERTAVILTAARYRAIAIAGASLSIEALQQRVPYGRSQPTQIDAGQIRIKRFCRLGPGVPHRRAQNQSTSRHHQSHGNRHPDGGTPRELFGWGAHRPSSMGQPIDSRSEILATGADGATSGRFCATGGRRP